jgi:hypothetical protein
MGVRALVSESATGLLSNGSSLVTVGPGMSHLVTAAGVTTPHERLKSRQRLLDTCLQRLEDDHERDEVLLAADVASRSA